MTVHKTLNQAFIIFLLFLLAACQQTSPVSLDEQAFKWTQLGNTLDTATNNRIDNIELVTEASGNLAVAWQGDWQENGKIYAKRWLEDEKRWKALAVVTPSSGGDFSLSASQHKLGVAFAKASFINNQLKSSIYVKREKGQSWEILGSAFRNDVGSTFSLAMNNQANPFITYKYENNIYVKQWKFNDQTYHFEWQQLGGKLNTPTGNVSTTVLAENPQIILVGFNQTLLVAWFEINWSETPAKIGVRIKRWENGAWIPFDFIETVAAPFFYFQKDLYGFPVVTSEDNSGIVNIWSWVNSTRSLRASLSSNNSFPHHSSLAFDGFNRPMVIYTKGFEPSKLSVKLWNGSSWVNVGQGVDEAPIGYDQVALVTGFPGPVVALAEIEPGVPSGFQNNLYVQRYQ
jgi:hypothetical protein